MLWCLPCRKKNNSKSAHVWSHPQFASACSCDTQYVLASPFAALTSGRTVNFFQQLRCTVQLPWSRSKPSNMSWRHCLALILGTALLVCTPAVAQITFPDAPPTAAAPVASPAAALPIAAVQVEPFSTIQVCAPINVLVVPSNSSNNYTVTAEADTAVLQSLVAVVQNGTLQLQSSGNFNTSNIISLQVCLSNEQH